MHNTPDSITLENTDGPDSITLENTDGPREENKSQSITTPPSVHTFESQLNKLLNPLCSLHPY